MGMKPGPPPDNEPGDFEYLTDNRLLHNPNITRMPTTQREWNSFIQELNKWIKNETGNFDVGGSATAQFTGFSSDPSSASIWWHRFGQMVHMEFHFGNGTSDATSFTITGIPEAIRPRDDQTRLIGSMRDNGSDLTTISLIRVGANGTLSFFKDATESSSSWTGASTKGFGAPDTKPSIIYSLRQPGKH